MTMMPIVDDNDIIFQHGMTRQQSLSEQDLSWLDSIGEIASMDFVDSVLAESLQNQSNIEDVLAPDTPEMESSIIEPVPVPAMTAEDMTDFLLDLDIMEQPAEENKNIESHGISVSRDIFEPIPLSNIQNRFAIVDDKFAKLTVPKAGFPLLVQHNIINQVTPGFLGASSRATEDSSSSSSDEEQSRGEGYSPKFRGYQCDQWQERYQELFEFFEKNGHSSVPHTDSTNKRLARWVKRQRYQYKLRQEGKPSAMTDERIKALEHLQFTWDSHGAAFEDRLKELEEFKAKHKHCNVPSNYRANSSLASWVKCQRRQYRLYREGKHSNITQTRIDQLERMGFQFNLRVGYHHHQHNHRHRSSGGWQ